MIKKKQNEILFFTKLFYPHVGGVEKQVMELSIRLIKLGYKITIVTEKYSDRLKNEEENNGIKIIRFLPLKLKFIGLILLGLGLSSLMCILSTGNDFTYYWFQFWGIVALTIPFAIKLLESIINFFSKRQINYLLFYILTVIFISDYFILWTKEEWGKKEPLFEVANYLKDKISKQDTLIAFGEGSHILYFLLDLKVPTIYVHPYNNWGGLKEFRRMAKLKPLYIVDSGPDGFWYNYTSKYYKIDYVIEKHIIYKLKRF